MISYTDTTVFNTTAQTIVNTVNCVGVMGGGIALDFRLRYPSMYLDYAERCRRGEVRTGEPYLYTSDIQSSIVNFPTKHHWKYPSRIDWIDQGLRYFVAHYQEWGVNSIAFPQLGCGKGNLNWVDVKVVMEKRLASLDIPVFICLDQEAEATGVEGSMVKILNNNVDEICDKLRIKTNIVAIIRKSLPIHRFRDLQYISGVGKQTYEIIFSYLYEHIKNEQENTPSTNNNSSQFVQTTMFW